MKNLEDDDYYEELHAALRSHDNKLWMIPGLFFSVVGLIVINLNLNQSSLIKDLLLSLIGFIFLWLLLIRYNKVHLFHIFIQKKINEFDNKHNNKIKNGIKRIPLTSMRRDETKKAIQYLEKKSLKSNESARFNFIQKCLAGIRVSSWIRNLMILTLLSLLGFIVYSSVNYFS